MLQGELEAHVMADFSKTSLNDLPDIPDHAVAWPPLLTDGSLSEG